MIVTIRVEDLGHRRDESGANRYNGPAKFLHWTIAALVVVQYATKLIPDGYLGVFTENRLDALHGSIGLTILIIMVVRLVWRLTHRAPSPPDNLPVYLKLISRATHWLFYAILLLLPILGWITASAYGMTSNLLGFIMLPAVVAPDERLGGKIGQVHGLIAWTLLAIIALHVVGAMYHAMVKKDDLLSRMLPR